MEVPNFLDTFIEVKLDRISNSSGNISPHLHQHRLFIIFYICHYHQYEKITHCYLDLNSPSNT